MKTGIYLLLLACFLALSTVSCGLFVQELPNGKVPNPAKHDHFVEIDGVHYHYTEYPATDRTYFCSMDLHRQHIRGKRLRPFFNPVNIMCGPWT
jgi:hypothetical protein